VRADEGLLPFAIHVVVISRLRFDSASQTLKLIIGGGSFTVNMTQDEEDWMN